MVGRLHPSHGRLGERFASCTTRKSGLPRGVIPAKAGIHRSGQRAGLNRGFHRNDSYLRHVPNQPFSPLPFINTCFIH